MNVQQCQNCTKTINNMQIGNTDNQQNCWIVFIVSFIFIIGLYKFLNLLYKMISPLSFFPFNLYQRYASKQTKTWALVTGGSQGIGLGFAQQLAKRNFNIIIISRSENKLQKAKQQILKVNDKVQVKYISVDFEKYRTVQQYQQFVKNLDSYDISVLVNNVGYFNPDKYLKVSYQLIKRQAILNLLPITCLTRLILPKMLQRNKKFNKRSGIINLASAAAQGPLSYSSHYCATKAFDDLLTRSVQVQYRRQSVDFVSLRPYLVTSSMTRNQNSILHVSANQCANGTLNDLGRVSISYGPIWHRIQGVLVEQLNGKLINMLLCQINKQNSIKYKLLDQKNQ